MTDEEFEAQEQRLEKAATAIEIGAYIIMAICLAILFYPG